MDRKERKDGFSDVSLKGLFWTFEGRLDRRRFIQRLALLAILAYLARQAGLYFLDALWGVLLMIPFYIFSFSLVSRRAHDLGENAGKYLIGWVIPILQLVEMGALMIRKGTEGTNSFGEDPLLYKPWKEELK